MAYAHDDEDTFTSDCTPILPGRWRELVTRERQHGLPNSPQHQWAYRNFVRACFPTHISTTDQDVLDQIEAWWVLTQLPRDTWRYWLTARTGEDES